MADNIYDLSTTAASNGSTGGWNAAENQNPSTVNDGSRQGKALIAQFIDDLGGVVTVGGTADALTVTLASGITAYAAGLIFAFKAASTNTGAATINVNGIGVKKLRRKGDTALNAGDITANGRYLCVYDADYDSSAGAVVVLNPDTITVGGIQVFPTIPQNSKSAAYTTVLADAGKHILHPSSDNNARTFTIDSNANVAYPIGTAITFVNRINTVTIAITSDTLIFAGDGSTGSRSLAVDGMATAIKIGTTEWMISGAGLT